MVGLRSDQCAVTSTISRGASGVPSFRSSGTLVWRDLTMSLCIGSPSTGSGPPPWEIQITGARVMLGDAKEVNGNCWKFFWSSGVEILFNEETVSANAKEDVRRDSIRARR